MFKLRSTKPDIQKFTSDFRRLPMLTMLIFSLFSTACANETEAVDQTQAQRKTQTENNMEIATFGAGCFWCVEAIFQRLEGVEEVQSGYMGGEIKNPSYKEVCTGRTGHAEVCQITFDPAVISFDELLSIFWQTHDPTTLNRQGADVGTQYRSAIFYHSDEQKDAAEAFKMRLDASGEFNAPIVTEITAASAFYPAEDYHQDYFMLNGDQPYCRAVIAPKVEKFEKYFKDKLKD